MGDIFLNVEEVDRFATPFEVVNELVRGVTLLQDESVMEQFSKLVDHVNILVLGDTARELSQLAHFEDQVFLDLIKLASDELEGVEVPFLTVLLQVDHLFLEFVELTEDRGNFEQNRLLALLSVLEVSEGFMLEKAIDKESLDLFELCEEVIEFLVVVFLDTLYFLTHRA